MKPIYKSMSFYDIEFTYTDTNTGKVRVGTTITKNNLYEVQNAIDDELDRVQKDLDQGFSEELTKVDIIPKIEVVDKSVIIGWEDVRPGDYAIHIHSRNNVTSGIEVGFDFYVGKLNREHEIYVDKYYMCWHAYQGAFLISRYHVNSSDKESNTPIMTIYDERLFPTINDVETEVGRKWAYIKAAKYAGMFAIESPGKEEINGIEV